MNIVSRIAGALGFERRADGDPYWENFSNLRSGPVNAATAQGVSAVYGCVSAISETVASLPLVLYRRKGDDDRERAKDHPLYKVLHDQPNDNQTALEFREWMQACVLLRGNAYARIVRGYDGQVRELLPIHPDRMSVLRVNGRLGYEYTDHKGELFRLLSDEVMHLRMRAGEDAVLGISPITAARGVIELALAEQDHGNATFRNGAKLSGVLKFPSKLKPDQREQLRHSFNSQYGGGGNSGKTAILEEGVEYQTISMTLQDAEWIAARQFSVEEVCRLFRTPPTIVGDLRHGNYSNSVELARQFVTMSLRRHLVAWEQTISKQLLTEAGQRIYFAEHQVEGLLRGDATNRADFYTKGIDAGWLMPSEARRLENLPEIKGLDDAKRNQAAQPTDPQAPPAGTAAEDQDPAAQAGSQRPNAFPQRGGMAPA